MTVLWQRAIRLHSDVEDGATNFQHHILAVVSTLASVVPMSIINFARMTGFGCLLSRKIRELAC